MIDSVDLLEPGWEEKQHLCKQDKFCTFVQHHDTFSSAEVLHLQAVILNKKLSSILYVSATLAVWSMTAAWIDAVILPFIIVYTIALPGASYYPLLFPIVWTIFNASLKFVYIRHKLGGAITLRDNLLAVFPYAGAAFLLKNWFVGDPLLRRASLAFIAHQKKQAINLSSILKQCDLIRCDTLIFDCRLFWHEGISNKS
ncbi:MAG: hypothetical protein HC819_14235 [Cyclobacteriaceae bacterium]|nr:hypothetical protein [Cyclobacteriaceae bacterium]